MDVIWTKHKWPKNWLRQKNTNESWDASFHRDIEAEDLIEDANVTGGSLTVQGEHYWYQNWGNHKQLRWTGVRAGDRLTLNFEREEPVKTELKRFLYKGQKLCRPTAVYQR